jgi:hypothetical protein
MGVRERLSVARQSLHSIERFLSQFVPAEEVQKLVSLPENRKRLLPLRLVLWSLLQMVDLFLAEGKSGRGLLRRFRVRIHAVDSRVLELVSICMDCVKHRRSNAAANMQLGLDRHSFLPSFASLNLVGEHDKKRAHEP